MKLITTFDVQILPTVTEMNLEIFLYSKGNVNVSNTHNPHRNAISILPDSAALTVRIKCLYWKIKIRSGDFDNQKNIITKKFQRWIHKKISNSNLVLIRICRWFFFNTFEQELWLCKNFLHEFLNECLYHQTYSTSVNV